MCLRSIPRRFSGSSPRLWGTGRERGTPRAGSRFIPTSVGNGVTTARSSVAFSVHPHACGERGFVAQPTKRKSGSSPRLWGTGRWRPMRSSWRRFIPTPVGNGAGETTVETLNRAKPFPTPVGNGLARLILLMVQTVHPHACGERRYSNTSYSFSAGSSPRLWGTGCGG